MTEESKNMVHTVASEATPVDAVPAPSSEKKSLRLRVDLAGSLSNAIRALRGETRAFGMDDIDENREQAAYMLEMIIEHIGQVRSGDRETLDDFCDFYGLAPGAMLRDRSGPDGARSASTGNPAVTNGMNTNTSADAA
jgi:hypothetical protein